MILQYLLLFYFSMMLVKLILCLPDVPIVVAALSRLDGLPRGKFSKVYLVGVPLSLTLGIVFLWPRMLVAERLAFFVSYPKREVLADCVAMHRALTKAAGRG